MAKEINYFTHDFNARNEDKMLCMRRKWKMEGVGIYWSIIEMLNETENRKLSLLRLDAVAMQLQCRTDKVQKFINDCSSDPINLFIKNGEWFWSESTLKRAKIRDDKKEQKKYAASVRWKNEKNNNNDMQDQSNADAESMQSNADAEQNDAKEIKGNKIKPKVFYFIPFKKNITKLDLDEQIKKLFDIWQRDIRFNELVGCNGLIKKYGIENVWFAFNQCMKVTTREKDKCNLAYAEGIIKRKIKQ